MSQDAGAESRDESSGSMASQPPYRISLALWLALIAVVAVCLAWVRPVLLPMILLPVALVAFFPRQTTRFAIEASAAVGWLLGLAESFSRLQIDIGDEMLLGVAGMFLALLWNNRLEVGSALDRESSLWSLRRLTTPLIGLVGVILFATDRDFDLRLKLSEPALRASANRIRALPGDHHERGPAQVGLFWTSGTEAEDGCVIWWTRRKARHRVGVAYLPEDLSLHQLSMEGRYDIRQIRGPWREVHDFR